MTGTDKATAYDVTIIGAGPAGLGLARSLAGSGLRIAIVERLPRAALENPLFDGREIALTHESLQHLRTLRAWDSIPAAEISPMGEARVLNGPYDHALRFRPPGQTEQNLGHLVPNHLIRRALFESVAACLDIELFTGRIAAEIETSLEIATLTLDDGTRLTSRLVVAADTRFSEMRRRMGITARRRDFGKTMMVCRMAHEGSHNSVATEWFGYGRTIAILPLNGNAETRLVVSGEPPNPIHPPSGCRFHTRCPRATDICAAAEPALTEYGGGGHMAACHHPQNVSADELSGARRSAASPLSAGTEVPAAA